MQYFTPPFPSGCSPDSTGLCHRRPATLLKDSRMKRLITLGFGLFLTAVATGCCCWPCCGGGGCGSGCGYGGCGPGGCSVPGGIPTTSNYAPSCSTCAY